jgi:hypothetical protein
VSKYGAKLLTIKYKLNKTNIGALPITAIFMFLGKDTPMN